MYFQRFKYLCFLLLFLFAAVTSVHARQQEAVSLKLNLKKGDRYYMPSVNEMTMTMDMMGMSMDMSSNTTFGFEFYVEDVDENQIATMDVTFKDIAFKANVAGAPGAAQSIVYDSKKQTTPTDPAAKAFAAMVGKSYKMKLASNGRIEEVQGLKEILSSVASLVDAGSAVSFEGLIDEKSIQQSMSLMFDIYPGKPVRIGDTWTKKDSIAMGFLNLEVAGTYSLQARSEGMSTVEVASTIKMKPGGVFPGAGMMDATVNMSGTQKGTFVISEDSGWIKEGAITQNISGYMEMVNPATNETISMPMSFISKTSYTSEKK